MTDFNIADKIAAEFAHSSENGHKAMDIWLAGVKGLTGTARQTAIRTMYRLMCVHRIALNLSLLTLWANWQDYQGEILAMPGRDFMDLVECET